MKQRLIWAQAQPKAHALQ